MQWLRVLRPVRMSGVSHKQPFATKQAKPPPPPPEPTSVDFSKLTRKSEDIKIPTSWGYMAARWWGPKDIQPVVTLHGWLENSASWDPFLNMVPEDEKISFLTVDMPGNGLSSHFPKTSWYHTSEDMVAMRLLMKHFNFKKPVTFLCHSYSTGHAFVYTAAYPQEVKKLVTVDLVKPMGITIKSWVESGGARLDKVIDFMESYNPKPKTVDQLAAEYHKATMGSISVEAARYLLLRSTAPVGDDPTKVVNTRDPRQSIDFYYTFPHEFQLELAKQIKCPFYTIRASRPLYFENPKLSLEVEAVLRESCSHFERVDVEGTHHVHMDHPERVYEPIMRWLKLD